MKMAHTNPTRLDRRRADVLLVQRASAAIDELGDALDGQLARETRPAERLRMLREMTNRVTRTANDAIGAYSRVRAALAAEYASESGDHAAAARLQEVLSGARADVLVALAAVESRFAWGYTASTGEDLAGPAGNAIPADHG